MEMMEEEFTDLADVDSDEEENTTKVLDISTEVSVTKEEQDADKDVSKSCEEDTEKNIPNVFFNCTQQIKLKQKLMQLVSFHIYLSLENFNITF